MKAKWPELKAEARVQGCAGCFSKHAGFCSRCAVCRESSELSNREVTREVRLEVFLHFRSSVYICRVIMATLSSVCTRTLGERAELGQPE